MITKEMKKEQSVLKRIYEEHLLTEWKCEKMRKYSLKQALLIVPLSEGRMFVIDKEHLETSICRSYCAQANNYDEAREAVTTRLKQSFLEENMQNVRRFADRLNEKYVILCPKRDNKSLVYIHTCKNDIHYKDDCTYGRIPNDHVIASPADVEQLKEMAWLAHDIQSDRLDKYLKKYGTEKLRAWTFDSWD